MAIPGAKGMTAKLWRTALTSVLIAQIAFPATTWAGPQGRDLQVEALRTKAALWVLTIGVSEYADERISLEYADHDALQVAHIMKSQQGNLYREVFTKVLVNEEATRGEILKAMSGFLGQASQEDVVLIFLAGHGLQDRQTGTYYFVPHNADSANLVYEGLPMPMFEEAIKRIRVNVDKVVLWLDTCHAGAMTVSARGVNTGEDLAETLAEASGQYVLSASKAGEESLEDESYMLEGEDRAHGAFTYSLLRGLHGAAVDTSGVVWLSDLFGHVSREVPRLTGGRQHPYGRQEGTDIPLFVLADGTQGAVEQQTQEFATPTFASTSRKEGGGKKWLWMLLGVAAVGGGAAVGLSGGGGTDPGGDTQLDPPPDHP